MAAGSLNLGVITEAQSGGFLDWFLLPLLPLFFVYLHFRRSRNQQSAI